MNHSPRTWFGAIPVVLATLCPANSLGQSAPMTARTGQMQSRVELVAEQLSLQKRTGVLGEGEFQRRYTTLASALKAWNESHRTDADADIMANWLDQASQAAMIGARRPMPAAPAFPERVFQPEQSIAALPVPGTTVEPVPAPEHFEPSKPPAATDNPTTPRSAAVTEKTVVVDSEPQQKNLDEVEPPESAPSGTAPYEDIFAEIPADPPNFEPMPSKPPTPEPLTTEPIATPLVEEAPKLAWADHPAARQIDWGDPFADDPRTSDATLTAKSPSRANRFKPVAQLLPDSKRVKLDLLELSSRVAGHNSRLRELEGLLFGSQDLTAFRLAAIVRDLEELLEQRTFLQLYLVGMSEEEKSLGPQLDSLDTMVNFLRRAMEQREEDLLDVSDSQANAEQAILIALDRKISELTPAE